LMLGAAKSVRAYRGMSFRPAIIEGARKPLGCYTARR
jgi:hypothetical protein